MTDTLRVRTVEGRLLPWENNPRRGHVGWSPTPEGEDFDHEIDGVVKLTRSEDVLEVPNTAYYRIALRDGDLAPEFEPEDDADDESADSEPEPASDDAEQEV